MARQFSTGAKFGGEKGKELPCRVQISFQGFHQKIFEFRSKAHRQITCQNFCFKFISDSNKLSNFSSGIIVTKSVGKIEEKLWATIRMVLILVN